MTQRIRRTGGTVRRPLAAWSPAVHGLLRYLAAAGFPAPAVIGTDGEEEILTWIDGESGADGWARIVPEAGLPQWARFLRRYHDIVAGFQPAQASEWASGAGTCAPGEVVCHGDFGPWNTVWRGREIAGLIGACLAGDVEGGSHAGAAGRQRTRLAPWDGTTGVTAGGRQPRRRN